MAQMTKKSPTRAATLRVPHKGRRKPKSGSDAGSQEAAAFEKAARASAITRIEALEERVAKLERLARAPSTQNQQLVSDIESLTDQIAAVMCERDGYKSDASKLRAKIELLDKQLSNGQGPLEDDQRYTAEALALGTTWAPSRQSAEATHDLTVEEIEDHRALVSDRGSAADALASLRVMTQERDAARGMVAHLETQLKSHVDALVNENFCLRKKLDAHHQRSLDGIDCLVCKEIK